MENLTDISVHKQQTSQKTIDWYQNLLSDDQIYFVLKQTQKLHWWENPQEVFSVLSDIIYNVYLNLKKTPSYNPDTIWNLSTRKLLTQKEVFFMNTCLDYSLLTLQYMKNIWFEKINFVVNELSTQYPWLYKLHFWIEWIYENKSYYIDHKNRNTVIIGQWNFVSDYSDINEPVVNTITIPWNMISIDDTFPELCKNWIINLKYFSLQLLDIFKNKFKKDNTPEEWHNWFVSMVAHPQKPEIVIKNAF
jgi:hypothetical protein